MKYNFYCRFDDLFKNQDFLLASALHPRFKLNWLSVNNRFNCERALKELLENNHLTQNDNENIQNHTDSDDFFTFDHVEHDEEYNELACYLSSSISDVVMLKQFPNIKDLFIKLNTPLPSSAPCERLFSVGGLVFNDKMGRMSDSLIEEKVLLKMNTEYY